MPNQRPKILIADDHRPNLIAMRRVLAGIDAEIIEAMTGNDVLAAALDHEFALILLDVQMPDMNGFEAATLLAGEERTRSTPIIFVTASHADDVNRLRGYSFGAVDYITKPLNEVILLSKVRHLAHHDGLTGLANRLLFMARLEAAIARARVDNTRFALAYLDIDGFKPINDNYGHQAGDDLLKLIANRLRNGLRYNETVARLGGDEFAVILDVEDADAAAARANTIARALFEPYDVQSRASGCSVGVQIRGSLGVALYPLHGEDSEAMIHAADLAMYAAKREQTQLHFLGDGA